MILKNNGKIIQDCPQVNEKTLKYLNRFWQFPQKGALEKEREKLYTADRQWVLAKKSFANTWFHSYEGSIG